MRTVRIAQGLRCESDAWCGVRRRSGARAVLNKKNAQEERTVMIQNEKWEEEIESQKADVDVQRKRLSDIAVLSQTPGRPHRASMLVVIIIVLIVVTVLAVIVTSPSTL